MKTILGKRKVMKYCINSFITTLSALVIVVILFTGCYKESDVEFDHNTASVIANSLELEDYIIAYTEFQEAFATFNTEIKNIDFSKLRKNRNTEGNLVMHIPTSVCIENKVNVLNEKKKLLINKYPELVSFSSEIRQKCFQQGVEKSLILSRKHLKSGINIYQPRLKSGSAEFFTNGYCDYLADQVVSSNYVEVILLIFQDGTSMAYIDENATVNSSSMDLYQHPSTGDWYSSYYLNSPIETFVHTHINSEYPSQVDIDNKLSGLNYAIYYSGSMYYYPYY